MPANFDQCRCYVATLSDYERFVTRRGAHAKQCAVYEESRDPVDKAADRRQKDHYRVY